MNNKIRHLTLILVLIAFALIVVVLYENTKSPTQKEEIHDEEWFNDNCNCLARDIFACHYPGYTYNGAYCVNGTSYTNPIKKCSKYDCNGTIMEVGADGKEI